MRSHIVAAFLALVLTGCGGDGTSALSEGDPAPSFTLPIAGGAEVSLDQIVPGRPALLYFSMGPG